MAALRTRTPHGTPAEIACRVDVMGAIGRAVTELLVHAAPEARRGLVGEMARATYGHLLTFEGGAGRRSA